MTTQLIPCCVFFVPNSIFLQFNPLKKHQVIKVLTRCCKGNISITPLQFLVITQEEPSQIYPSLSTELKHRGPTESSPSCCDWSKHDQNRVRLLTNYSSSWRVSPMAVSLESWALNFPSVWVTGGQRGEQMIKNNNTRFRRYKARETSQYPLTAELQSQQFETCRSSPTCTALARKVTAAGD